MGTMTANADQVQEKEVGLLANFLTKEDFARQCGISVKTVDRWAVEGKGPARTKLGHRVLYSRRSVLAWLAECEQDPHRRDHRRRRRTV